MGRMLHLHITLNCPSLITFCMFLGNMEIEGLTDSVLPNRLGPKRASKIRKMFNLSKEDNIKEYVTRRQLPKKSGKLQIQTTFLSSLDVWKRFHVAVWGVHQNCQKDLILSVKSLKIHLEMELVDLNSYCSSKPCWFGMGKVVQTLTLPTLHPTSPPAVLYNILSKSVKCINCDQYCKSWKDLLDLTS